MRKATFLPTCCLALLASAVFMHVNGRAASANDFTELNCTDCCSECGTSICACSVSACDRSYLFPQSLLGVDLNGWVAGGFMGNVADPTSKFNGPYSGVDRSNEPMLNQLYLVGERALPACGWGVGGRVDMLYGEDYFLAQSTGVETRPDGSARWNPEYYGLAFPQAYVSMGSQNLSFQIGHFYSVVGYEGLMAPGNFFYSKSYSYQFASPFQHWGGQMNWQMNQAWTLQLGLVNGWDALDRVSDDVSFMGKIKYENQYRGNWTSFALINGKEFNNAGGLDMPSDFANRTRYSWLVGLPLTSRLEYVFHHWLGAQANGAVNGSTAYWYGIDQYLNYTFNSCWKAGLRFEWFRDEDGTRVGLNRPRNMNNPPYEGDFYSLSAGVNWKPTANLTLRPEVRADWYDGDAQRLPFDDGNDSSQVMLGLDAILLY